MEVQGCRHGYQPCPASLPALPATIALLAEDGHLVSLGKDLEKGASQGPSTGSPLLQERGTYVLVQVISKWGPRLAPLLPQLFWNVRRIQQSRDHPRPYPAPHFGQNLALTLVSNGLS